MNNCPCPFFPTGTCCTEEQQERILENRKEELKALEKYYGVGYIENL